MDKEALEKLLDGKPKEIRHKAILLFNGTATGAKAYQDEPSSATRRNWEDSEAALNKFIGEIGSAPEPEDDEDKPLRTIAAVLEYLKANDWRVTQTSLYRHQKEGKIAPRRDGCYTLRDVDKYARNWLKQKSTGKKVAEKAEEQQAKKLGLEISILEQNDKKLKFFNDREAGLYIPKELMEIELAGRAGILDAGLKHMVQSRIAEWIRAVNGEMKKLGDLLHLVNSDIDEHINSYASALSYQVVIEAEEDAPAEVTQISESPETESKTEGGLVPC